ncbi:hypothetical protein ANO11243_008000 [Dothideomycetidae sp. 11243]|nr:hypothetical protein ANO11243_008000 [fungal sp. No.11243]
MVRRGLRLRRTSPTQQAPLPTIVADLSQQGAVPCITACCCLPCFYGRAVHRLRHYPEEPTQSNGFEWLNKDCLIICGLGYVMLGFLPLYLLRQEQREKFNIPGSAAEDAGLAYCCPVCTATQSDLDLVTRADSARMSGHNQQAYTNANEKMSYAPPPPQALDQLDQQQQQQYQHHQHDGGLDAPLPAAAATAM